MASSEPGRQKNGRGDSLDEDTPMLTAECHCGAVRVEVPRKPRTLTDCNCSICRRYGALWAYYLPESMRAHFARGAVARYSWRRHAIAFVHCRRCGCVTHYERLQNPGGRRAAVNARMFDPALIAGVRIRRLDGASTWKYLD